jgi:hypothetical protein
MGNFKQCIYILFLVTVIFSSCTKENIAPANNPQTSNANAAQSLVYNNITIVPSGNHVFSIPGITQSVIDKGLLAIYATNASSQTAQWATINNCESHIDITSITVGKVQIQNNEAAAVFMSFRFDITGN